MIRVCEGEASALVVGLVLLSGEAEAEALFGVTLFCGEGDNCAAGDPSGLCDWDVPGFNRLPGVIRLSRANSVAIAAIIATAANRVRSLLFVAHFISNPHKEIPTHRMRAARVMTTESLARRSWPV
jgi:hypothetical protein